MPNWCENELRIVANTTKEVTDFLDRYSLKTGEGDGCGFDFDKIVPEPRKVEDCPIDCLVNDDNHIEIYEDRPWFDWYKWRNKYWGVKWNARDVSIDVHMKDTTIYINFFTPWGEPTEIIDALKEQNPHLGIKNLSSDQW